MTEKERAARKPDTHLSELFEGSSCFELRRSHGRCALTLGGVVSVQEIGDECIRASTHSGTVLVRGSRLLLSVFEERTVKIYGKITSVELGYGRT